MTNDTLKTAALILFILAGIELFWWLYTTQPKIMGPLCPTCERRL